MSTNRDTENWGNEEGNPHGLPLEALEVLYPGCSSFSIETISSEHVDSKDWFRAEKQWLTYIDPNGDTKQTPCGVEKKFVLDSDGKEYVSRYVEYNLEGRKHGLEINSLAGRKKIIVKNYVGGLQHGSEIHYSLQGASAIDVEQMSRQLASGEVYPTVMFADETRMYEQGERIWRIHRFGINTIYFISADRKERYELNAPGEDIPINWSEVAISGELDPLIMGEGNAKGYISKMWEEYKDAESSGIIEISYDSDGSIASAHRKPDIEYSEKEMTKPEVSIKQYQGNFTILVNNEGIKEEYVFNPEEILRYDASVLLNLGEDIHTNKKNESPSRYGLVFLSYRKFVGAYDKVYETRLFQHNDKTRETSLLVKSSMYTDDHSNQSQREDDSNSRNYTRSYRVQDRNIEIAFDPPVEICEEITYENGDKRRHDTWFGDGRLQKSKIRNEEGATGPQYFVASSGNTHIIFADKELNRGTLSFVQDGYMVNEIFQFTTESLKNILNARIDITDNENPILHLSYRGENGHRNISIVGNLSPVGVSGYEESTGVNSTYDKISGYMLLDENNQQLDGDAQDQAEQYLDLLWQRYIKIVYAQMQTLRFDYLRGELTKDRDEKIEALQSFFEILGVQRN